jgi:hypothetical protein
MYFTIHYFLISGYYFPLIRHGHEPATLFDYIITRVIRDLVPENRLQECFWFIRNFESEFIEMNIRIPSEYELDFRRSLDQMIKSHHDDFLRIFDIDTDLNYLTMSETTDIQFLSSIHKATVGFRNAEFMAKTFEEIF